MYTNCELSQDEHTVRRPVECEQWVLINGWRNESLEILFDLDTQLVGAGIWNRPHQSSPLGLPSRILQAQPCQTKKYKKSINDLIHLLVRLLIVFCLPMLYQICKWSELLNLWFFHFLLPDLIALPWLIWCPGFLTSILFLATLNYWLPGLHFLTPKSLA